MHADVGVFGIVELAAEAGMRFELGAVGQIDRACGDVVDGGLAIVTRLRARQRGFPVKPGAFSLGRWGIPINIVALIWGGAMLINFAWHRVATNPKASETDGLLSFPGFLNDIPILWLVLGFVLVVGGLYYLARRHHIPAPNVPESARAELA